MLAMMFNAPINAGKRVTSNIAWVRNQRHTKDLDVAHTVRLSSVTSFYCSERPIEATKTYEL